MSGFVILAERSMRIGDNVRVDNFEGIITDINALHRGALFLGRESIVPNESSPAGWRTCRWQTQPVPEHHSGRWGTTAMSTR